MEIEIDVHEIADMAKAYEQGPRIYQEEMTKGLSRCLIVVRNAAVRLVRVKTGRLRGSIAIEGPASAGGYIAGKVGTNVTYAPIVERGSPPHVIVPVKKRALYWQGAAHPVARVNHPGTKPDPYLEPASRNSIPQINTLIAGAARSLMTRIAGGR